MAMVAVCAALIAHPALGQIRFRTGTVETVKKSAAELTTAIGTLAERSDARHIVAQFERPINQAERARLEAAGLSLQSYLSGNAFFATIHADRLNIAALTNAAPFKDVLSAEREWKLHPFLVRGKIPEYAVVSPSEQGKVDPDPIMAVYLLFHPDVPLVPDGLNIVARHGAWVRSRLESVNGLVIELPFTEVGPLADEDGVLWIEPPLPKFSELNNSNRQITQADLVQQPPYSLTGAGVSVLVYDGGYGLSSHADFQGRHTVRDSSGLSDHATHVAGTIGGAGVVNALYKGMAPGVTFESYGFEWDGSGVFLYNNPGDLENDYAQAINTYGVHISNNSIGTNTALYWDCEITGDYGVTSNLIDTIVRGDGSNPLFSSPLRVVWANGNERQTSRCGSTYYTTAPPACAKNHITVGALNSNNDSVTSFTSWGPTDDGRLKPDISGPGCQSNDDGGVTSCSSSGGYTTMCGTSMSCPTVCGLSALLLQDFRARFPGDPDPRNSTLKVLLIQGAADIQNTGPDYQTGYGSVRIRDTIDFMRTGNFIEQEVSQGETYSVVVVVNPGDPELKITLAWDDYPAVPLVIPSLVNDLDLVVTDPNSTRRYPWTLNPASPSSPAVQTQEDHVNNIEQVVVNSPTPGAWRVEVVGSSVPQGPQPFSLAASPLLVNCSSQGIISLDRPAYQCESTAEINVVDCDLNTDDGVVETVTVTIASDSEPAGESVLLTESAPESADFRNTIALSGTDSAGTLQVAEGDTVTATYVDADDGQGGTNVVVTDTAVVDCQPPQISNVQVTDIGPYDATVTFLTDEPATTGVRYGTNCAALGDEASGAAFDTQHSITITGLAENTTYFLAVDAQDAAGNASTDDNSGACYSFSTTDIPNYFTENFPGGIDLGNTMAAFTPNGSVDFYAGCAEEALQYPTDPGGATTLSLTDDSYATITLGGGAEVLLYGQAYSRFYVGSNGYITFNSGDSDYTESLSEHFAQPRISLAFDDLNPASGGSVKWQQLGDRAVVTYDNVPEYSGGGFVNSQVEMFFDGTVTITHLSSNPGDGVIVGLSGGGGIPPGFFETDLSAMGNCGPQPPVAQAVSASTAVSVPTTITLQASDDGLPDPPGALTYIITSLPTRGSLSDPGAGTIGSVPYALVGGGDQVVYAPQPDYRGQDAFNYKANDGGTPPSGGDSNVAAVTVTVGGPVWDPVAFDVSVSTAVSTPTDVTLAASDPNGDPLTYIIEALPAAGTLSDPGAGAISTVPYTLVGGGNVVNYAPPADEHLVQYTFDFSARDATAGSNVATVTVSLGGPAWDPVAFDVQATTPVNMPKDVTLVATDPNGDPLTYIIESLPAAGLLLDPQSGVISTAPYQLLGGGGVVTYIPPFGQNLQVTFDFSARDATVGSNVATVTVTVGGPQLVYGWNMDVDPGWSTEGLWAWGQPTGQGSRNPDPTSGYTGSNVYGYNLNGDYTSFLPPVYLTTQALDFGSATGVTLSFRRWLGVERSLYDHAAIEISTDGTSWSTVWEHSGPEIAEQAWSYHEYDISGVADNQPTVYLRWVMGPTDYNITYSGWNIDDVEIWALVPAAPPVGDLDGDGDVDLTDFITFASCYAGSGVTTPPGGCAPGDFLGSDLDSDGDVDLVDFTIFATNFTG